MHSLSFSMLALIFWNRYETTNDFARRKPRMGKNFCFAAFLCFFYVFFSTLRSIVRTTTASMSTARFVASYLSHFSCFHFFSILYNLCVRMRAFSVFQTLCMVATSSFANVRMMMWRFAVPIRRRRRRAKTSKLHLFVNEAGEEGCGWKLMLFYLLFARLTWAWCAMSSLKSALRVAVNRPRT